MTRYDISYDCAVFVQGMMKLISDLAESELIAAKILLAKRVKHVISMSTSRGGSVFFRYLWDVYGPFRGGTSLCSSDSKLEFSFIPD